MSLAKDIASHLLKIEAVYLKPPELGRYRKWSLDLLEQPQH